MDKHAQMNTTASEDTFSVRHKKPYQSPSLTQLSAEHTEGGKQHSAFEITSGGSNFGS